MLCRTFNLAAQSTRASFRNLSPRGVLFGLLCSVFQRLKPLPRLLHWKLWLEGVSVRPFYAIFQFLFQEYWPCWGPLPCVFPRVSKLLGHF